MDPDLTIGPASPRDAGPIAQLAASSIERGLPRRWSAARVRRALARPDHLCVVAHSRGALAGFAIAEINDRATHLALFAVAPGLRRAGLGSRLLSWVIDASLAAGKRALTLEVRASAEGARAFYAHAGFQRVAVRRGYYAGREDAIVMRRALGREVEDDVGLEELWGEGWSERVR